MVPRDTGMLLSMTLLATPMVHACAHASCMRTSTMCICCMLTVLAHDVYACPPMVRGTIMYHYVPKHNDGLYIIILSQRSLYLETKWDVCVSHDENMCP